MKNTKIIVRTKSKSYPIYFGDEILKSTATLIKKNISKVKSFHLPSTSLTNTVTVSEKDNPKQTINENEFEQEKVDLDDPEVEVVVLISDKIYLGIVTTKTGHVKCLKHHVNYRPEFYPISLNPRMARAMINVAGIKNNEIMLDPFCGTGGILIEGADMDLNIIGLLRQPRQTDVIRQIWLKLFSNWL